MTKINVDLVDKAKFWANVEIGAKDDCWNWKACKHPTGYGMLKNGSGTTYAHRVAFAITSELPAGMSVLHRCDNPTCCNPDHLWLGTQLDNIRDRDAKGRGARLTPEQHGCSRRVIVNGKEFVCMRDAAKAYGISPSLVYLRIKNKKDGWSYA